MTQDRTQDIIEELLEFCIQPKSKVEILEYFNYKNAKSFTKLYITPLLNSEKLKLTILDKPTSKNQKYIKA